MLFDAHFERHSSGMTEIEVQSFREQCKSASMTEAGRGPRPVSDVIQVIDEIAFQTDLLTLNAAAAAVRASDDGKALWLLPGGFASVVSHRVV